MNALNLDGDSRVRPHLLTKVISCSAKAFLDYFVRSQGFTLSDLEDEGGLQQQ